MVLTIPRLSPRATKLPDHKLSHLSMSLSVPQVSGVNKDLATQTIGATHIEREITSPSEERSVSQSFIFSPSTVHGTILHTSPLLYLAFLSGMRLISKVIVTPKSYAYKVF